MEAQNTTGRESAGNTPTALGTIAATERIMLESTIAHPMLSIDAWERASCDTATVIADGSQVRVAVRQNHLSVEDGVPGNKRERRYPRATPPKRVIVLGGHGFVTIEAQRWMADARVPWSIVDTYAATPEIVAISGGNALDARLVRAQCEAAGNSVGVEVTRYLLLEKMRGQLANVREYLSDDYAERAIEKYIAQTEESGDLATLGAMEGNAAREYFSAWTNRVMVPFSHHDMKRVPEHWREFAQRPSLAGTGGPNSHATDPINACLNFAYHIAETVAIHACHAYGLLPELGINHRDKNGRASMALDLIEVIRPQVDAAILRMMAPMGVMPAELLDRRYFLESGDGTVRLCAPLTHQITSHAGDWTDVLMPHAYHVARTLANAATGVVTVPKPRGMKTDAVKAHRSYPKNRLRDGITSSSVIPDALWEKIESLCPVIPANKRGPRFSTTQRELVAAFALRYVLAVPWQSVNVNKQTLDRNYDQWVKCGAWEKIKPLIENHGHLASLVE